MFATFRIKALSPHSEFSQQVTDRHFLIMVICAIVVHSLVLAVFQLMPKDDVLQIPVRSLNIKFGGSGAGTMTQTPNIGVPQAASTATVVQEVRQPEIAEMNAASTPAMKALESVISEAPSEIPEAAPKPQAAPKPAVNKEKPAAYERTAPVQQVLPKPVAQPAPQQQYQTVQTLPNIKPQAIPEEVVRAASQLPSEYVRGGGQGAGEKAGDNFGVKNGAVGGVGIGNKDGEGEAGSAEVLRRYEQVISLWIQHNKVYPAEAKAKGLQGQAVVRIRINREGTIIFSRIDRPTAHAELNQAIEQMVRASNPVPAVPSNYPAGGQFEFLIPVSFRLE